jgi:protein Mpv17
MPPKMLLRYTQLSNLAANVFEKATPARRAKVMFALMGGGIAGSADVTVQLANGSKAKDLDLRRTMSLSAFGCFYGGGLQRILYMRFDMWFGIGNSMKQTLVKLFMDTFVHAPIVYIPAFYMMTGMIQGLGLSGSYEKLKSKYNETLLSYWLIWPVPMFVCFRYIPETQRVLFISSIAFVEKCVYSYLGNRPQPTAISTA